MTSELQRIQQTETRLGQLENLIQQLDAQAKQNAAKSDRDVAYLTQHFEDEVARRIQLMDAHALCIGKLKEKTRHLPPDT